MKLRPSAKAVTGASLALIAAVIFVLVFKPAAPVLAFPTNTNVLDDFNRANGTITGSTSSSGDTWPGSLAVSTQNMSIVNTSQATGGGAGFSSAYMNNTYGPDTEVYATMSTLGNAGANEVMALFARISNPTLSSITAYYLEIRADGSWQPVRVNSSSTAVTIGLGFSQAISAGDLGGFSVTGTTNPELTAWHKTPAGSWTQVGTVTDDFSSSPPASNAPFQGSGRIGLETLNATPRLDDFSGGTVVTNAAPAAPTLIEPASSSTGVAIRPRFTMRTTDADADYLRYKIEVCTTSNCSSVLRTIDQTSSQTGWASQDTQSATAYTGDATIGNSRIAEHFYQDPPLNPSTQYWWRAYAIDPGGLNAFGTASSISTFTTGTNEVRIQGGTTIQGGTKIAN